MEKEVLVCSRAYKLMTNEIDWSGNKETGGILLGIINNKQIIIVEAVDGGPNSTASQTFFSYDYKYVEHVTERIVHLYKQKLNIIGVWHKHNNYHEYPFSRQDLELHEEICDMVGGYGISILFQQKAEATYEMGTYIIYSGEKYQKTEFNIL